MPVSNECPYCEGLMRVRTMGCDACQVELRAEFPQPRLAQLPIEHQRFIELFVLAGGSLKQIAEQAGVSYPTVRSRLDKVIDTLREAVQPPASSPRKAVQEPDAAQVLKSI